MLEGVCCCVDHDAGPEDWSFRETDPVARKDYWCVECRATIPRGTRHRCETGRWEGEWQTHRTCYNCLAVRNDLMQCSWIYGEMWSAIAECVADATGCDDVSWLHPMFADTAGECGCPECEPD